MGPIEFRRPWGCRGWFSTMSSTGLGNAGLGGRRSGNGRIIRGAALGWRMATKAGDIFRDGWNSARQKERGFECPFGGVLGGLRGQGSISRALGAGVAVKQRGRLQDQGLGCPIPCCRQAAVIPRIYRSGEIANRPGAMVPPKLYSMSFAPGILAGRVAGGHCYVDRAGAAWATARLRPLRCVFFLPALVGPGAGSQRAYKDMTDLSTSVAENFGRLAGYDRGAQLGIGRNVRRIAHLARASKDFHYIAESCIADARRGGVQIGDHLGIEP